MEVYVSNFENLQLNYKIVQACAMVGALLVLAMVSVTMMYGTGFQDFESLRTYQTIEVYNAIIVDAAPVLQMLYPLDTLYVFSYVVLIIAMAQVAPIRGFALLATIVVLITGFLDFVENNLILANSSSAELGNLVSGKQIYIGSIVTQTKFNFGLLLTLSISFLIPFETSLGTVTRWLARCLAVIAPVALLTPATTLLYIVVNIFLLGLIPSAYSAAVSHLKATRAN